MSDVVKNGAARVTVHGVEAFRAKMLDMPERMRKGVIRKLLRESMMVVRESARASTPVLNSPVTDKAGNPRRLPGTVRKAISVRTSKEEAKDGNVGVFVNVRPLKGNVYKRAGNYVDNNGVTKKRFLLIKKSSRGANNPRDPYYWRWLEFGTKQRKTKAGKALGAVRPYKFLQTAAGKLKDAVARFEKGLAQWVQAADKTGRPE